MVEIKNKYTGEVICSGETVASAAVANKSSLCVAELSATDFRSCDLSSAILYGADLRACDLRHASLCHANLCGANLCQANLWRTSLWGADLSHANLTGARINWQSHDLLAELLFRAAGQDPEKRKIAGIVLVSRDWCWEQFTELAASDPLGDWALDVLAEYVTGGDGAPGIVARRVTTKTESE